MTGGELTKLAKQTIAPYLTEKEFIWDGFKNLSYEISGRDEKMNGFYGTGRYYTRPNGLEIDLPLYSIYLSHFSQILNPILAKCGFKESKRTFGVYDISGDELSMRKDLSNHQIHNEETFEIWAYHFKVYWENYVTPFFERYVSIKDINKKIDDPEIEDWKQYLGSFPYLMKLMIYKFASNPKYREYSDWYLQHHEATKTVEGGIYLNYCLAALELYEELESGMFDGVVV